MTSALTVPVPAYEADPPSVRRAAADDLRNGGLRVVMVVANDVTRDSRVLREAAVLAASGHHVTVLGIMTAKTTAPPIELRDGFVIRRLPFRARPPGWWVPPDIYTRLGRRADRQLRLHRARVRSAARMTGRSRRLLVAQARRLPGRAARAARRVSARGWSWQARLPHVDLPTLPTIRLARPSRPTGPTRHRTWRRELRGLVRRARVTSLRDWPRKTGLLAVRMSKHLATAAADPVVAAARQLSAMRTTVRKPRIRPPRLRLGRLPPALGASTWVRLASVVAYRELRRRSTRAGEGMRVAGATIGRGAAAWANIVSLLVWGSGYLAANRLSGGAIEWLTGWRWRWLGWARYVVDHAPDADVWHGHDLTSLPAIVALKRRHGGIAVYDSHEIYVESGRHADQPRWAKAQLERLERGLVAEVDAVVTVNRSIATILAERLRLPSVEVLYNCPARFDRSPRVSPIRRALGLDRSAPLLLYHGALSPHRGIEELLEAIRLPALADAHLAFLGFGQLSEWLRSEVAAPSFGGRVHVLDAVAPQDLLDWLVGVDVAVAPIQPSTLNHRFSSPNKVFEAIAVGTPVAGSDFPEFRRVIADSGFGPLGALFDPSRPEAIAAAARGILDLSPAERGALRRRCRAAAQHRWNWETESVGLVDLYAGFATNLMATRLHAVGVA